MQQIMIVQPGNPNYRKFMTRDFLPNGKRHVPDTAWNELEQLRRWELREQSNAERLANLDAESREEGEGDHLQPTPFQGGHYVTSKNDPFVAALIALEPLRKDLLTHPGIEEVTFWQCDVSVQVIDNYENAEDWREIEKRVVDSMMDHLFESDTAEVVRRGPPPPSHHDYL